MTVEYHLDKNTMLMGNVSLNETGHIIVEHFGVFVWPGGFDIEITEFLKEKFPKYYAGFEESFIEYVRDYKLEDLELGREWEPEDAA